MEYVPTYAPSFYEREHNSRTMLDQMPLGTKTSGRLLNIRTRHCGPPPLWYALGKKLGLLKKTYLQRFAPYPLAWPILALINNQRLRHQRFRRQAPRDAYLSATATEQGHDTCQPKRHRNWRGRRLIDITKKFVIPGPLGRKHG